MPSERRAHVRNASDASQVKRAVESANRRAVREQSELRETLQTIQGARVLWRILESCGIHTLSFTSDPYRTAFNEGGRNEGNKLLAQIFAADPDAYLRMQKDAAQLDGQIIDPKDEKRPVIEEDDGN